VRIVRAEREDWERLRELRLRALLDAPEAFGSTHEREAAQAPEDWRAFAEGWPGTARQAVFVMEDDGGGWVGLAVGAVPEADTSLANLYAMWVDPAARGEGLGRQLVETVVRWAAGFGADRLELCVTEANGPAMSLYRSAGFEPTGVSDELRPGSGIRTVTLRRLLAVPTATVDGLMAEQMRYYEDRAPVYDQLWYRQGRYDRGPEFNERWFRETAALEASVPDTTGLRVLELACGTGIWTRRLAPAAARMVAVDASPAMLAHNRAAVADPRVEYVQGDLFTWSPADGETFDLIAFGYFLSHVPPDRFEPFWDALRGWLAPGGRVWFCDDAAGPDRPYFGDSVQDVPIANTRPFDTDEQYTIVKVFWHPRDLASRLSELGWEADVTTTGEHFLVGEAVPTAGA
jgi:SAM-dependent methyltransferase/GNAT superfamily N-acetyltransferase